MKLGLILVTTSEWMMESLETADNLTRKLVEFTRAYHASLEANLGSRGRDSFPYHGESTRLVSIFRGSDGYAAFYLPPPPSDLHIPEGYYVHDYSEHTLNEICQSLSLHRLQVAPAKIGERWDTFQTKPIDVPPIPGLQAPWFHDDVREAAKSGQLGSLPGMTASPIIHVEKGVRVRIEPARIRIWSPVFNFPGVGRQRLFLWTYADLWWYPQRLTLDPATAPQVAAADLLAFETVYRASVGFTPEIAQKDTSLNAAEILDGFCEEFLSLLDTEGHDEERLHQWLYTPDHRVFLDPHAILVRSKVPFGDKVSDFVIRRVDGTYTLIEIEAATTNIFQTRNQEPSAPFNHACQQVRDWQRYVRDNVHTVRTELDLPGIYEPNGMVVIGRSGDIPKGDAQIRWRDLKSKELELFTYDEWVDRVKALSRTLRKLLRE